MKKWGGTDRREMGLAPGLAPGGDFRASRVCRVRASRASGASATRSAAPSRCASATSSTTSPNRRFEHVEERRCWRGHPSHGPSLHRTHKGAGAQNGRRTGMTARRATARATTRRFAGVSIPPIAAHFGQGWTGRARGGREGRSYGGLRPARPEPARIVSEAV